MIDAADRGQEYFPSLVFPKHPSRQSVELRNLGGAGDDTATTRLDRLSRSLKELHETVETLKTQGTELISLKENIDTTSA